MSAASDDPDASAPDTSAAAPTNEPKCFVIVHNISKRHNIGTLARSASAFGVAEVRRGGGGGGALVLHVFKLLPPHCMLVAAHLRC